MAIVCQGELGTGELRTVSPSGRKTSFGSTQKPGEPFLLPGGGCRQHRPEPPGKGRGEGHDRLPVGHRVRRDLWLYLWESIPVRGWCQFGGGKSLGPAERDRYVPEHYPCEPFRKLSQGGH